MIAVVIAVVLSLSSPSQYRYVDVAETNLLTNVGMGKAVPPGEVELAYTDIAFLAEAFAERRFVDLNQSAPSPKIRIDKTVTSKGIPHDVLFPMSFPGHIDGWMPVNGFMTTNQISTALTAGPVRANYYEAHSSDAAYGAPLWHDLMMGTNQFATAFVTNTAFASGSRLLASDVAGFYEDLGRLGAYAYGGRGKRYGIGCEMDTVHRLSRIWSALIREYDNIRHIWVYDDNYTPSPGHSTNSEYTCSYSWAAKAIRRKNRGFEYDTSDAEWKDVTGVVSSSGYSDESYGNYAIGETPGIAIPFSPEQYAITVKSIRAFAMAFVSYSKTLNGQAVSETEGYVALPISTGFSEGRVLLPIGGDLDRALYTAAFEVMGIQTTTGSELLASVEAPDDPPESFDDYTVKSNEVDVNVSFDLVDVYIVIDYDFNAKTL